MTLRRSARVLLEGGPAVLVFARGGGDAALLLDGRPVALVGPDPDGGGRLLVRAHHLATIEDHMPLVEVDDGASLAEAVRPVLELLGEGRWRLDEVVAEGPAAADESGDVLDWAGLRRIPAEGELLVGTVPGDLLDERRVRDAELRLRAGRTPVVVTVGDADVAFVVAGHTALRACHRLGLPPVLLRLEPFDPPELTVDEAADLLARACAHVGDVAAAWYRAAHDDPADADAG